MKHPGLDHLHHQSHFAARICDVNLPAGDRPRRRAQFPSIAGGAEACPGNVDIMILSGSDALLRRTSVDCIKWQIAPLSLKLFWRKIKLILGGLEIAIRRPFFYFILFLHSSFRWRSSSFSLLFSPSFFCNDDSVPFHSMCSAYVCPNRPIVLVH